MGAHRQRQGGTSGVLGASDSPWKCCKVFCALVFTEKGSVDQLFMHYFHNISSAFGGFAPRPSPGLHPWTPLGTFVSRPLICPPMERILWAPMALPALFSLCAPLHRFLPRPLHSTRFLARSAARLTLGSYALTERPYYR